MAGERRWRAAQKAQLHEIRAIVRELTDAETLEIALIENIQRRDLNPIEEGEGYKRLIDEFGHSQAELAALVHKSRSHVANMMRLLDLPKLVRELVVEGLVRRRQGAGTFVTNERPRLDLIEVRNIADDIRSRGHEHISVCLLYTSPSPRDRTRSRMPSSA